MPHHIHAGDRIVATSPARLPQSVLTDLIQQPSLRLHMNDRTHTPRMDVSNRASTIKHSIASIQSFLHGCRNLSTKLTQSLQQHKVSAVKDKLEVNSWRQPCLITSMLVIESLPHHLHGCRNPSSPTSSNNRPCDCT